jgi:hypothetical protein
LSTQPIQGLARITVSRPAKTVGFAARPLGFADRVANLATLELSPVGVGRASAVASFGTITITLLRTVAAVIPVRVIGGRRGRQRGQREG